MPNWVFNHLQITSDKKSELEQLINYVKMSQSTEGAEKDFDFNRIVPVPDELWLRNVPHEYRDIALKDNKNDYGYESWYEFCCNKWGTKWNACDVTKSSLHQLPNGSWTIVYTFNTAWTPPVAVLCSLSLQFENCDFELNCNKEANLFQPFHMVIKGGNEISCVELDIPEDDD